MTVLSGIGVIAALCLMAFLIFKKVSPLLAGPIAVVVVCASSRLTLFDALTDTYLKGVAEFFVSYFPVFLLGNLLGSIYEMSGSAVRIGQIIGRIFGTKKEFNCMIACLVCAALLSYGGINSFVIIFAVYPISSQLFREADIPVKLLPGIICGGMWTFAMTGPFTPQIPNILSMENLGTTSYAGLVPGICSGVCMAVMIVAYMTYEAKKCKKAGLGYEEKRIIKAEIQAAQAGRAEKEDRRLPSGFAGFFPLALVVLGFNLTNLSILIWLCVGILAALILQFPYLDKKDILQRANRAAAQAVAINMNTAAVVGFGSVTGLTPFYLALVKGLSEANVNPYLMAVLGSNLCVSILGSSSGGMALMYTSLRDVFLQCGMNGYDLGCIHRLASMGGGCLDSMPWNGSIISIFSICGTTHKESYKYNFVTCGLIPLLCTVGIALPVCMLIG
jgi:H+/gluconate symporter and related permeases